MSAKDLRKLVREVVVVRDVAGSAVITLPREVLRASRLQLRDKVLITVEKSDKVVVEFFGGPNAESRR